MFKEDMTPGQELIPLTIDAQYVPGFTWLRNPKARVVQHFGMVSAGLALESPQAVIFNGPNAPLVPTTDTNPGGRNLDSAANYSTDVGPDLVAKVSLDPGWGHFEAYGLGRAFRSSAAAPTPMKGSLWPRCGIIRSRRKRYIGCWRRPRKPFATT
jgi:hypothetical protein